MKEYIKTTKENTYLRVEVKYNIGGMNYFTYKDEPRGYYLSVSPVERDGHFESYQAFSGIKQCILEVKRQSKKQAEKAEQLAETYKENLINYVLNKNGLSLEKD